MAFNKRFVAGMGIWLTVTTALAGCAPESPSTAGGANATNSSPAGNLTTATNQSPSHPGNTTTANAIQTAVANQDATQSVNTTAYQAGTSGRITDSGTQFPGVVTKAMQQFPTHVLQGAEAPTMLPSDDAGASSLYYRTWDATSGPILSYSVQFSSPKHPLATFSGSTYSGISAGDAVWLPRGLASDGQTTHSSVHLTAGILAEEQTYVAPKNSAKEVSSASLTWQEGRWQIEVSFTGGTQVPVVEADAVAAFLHSHFMPVPESKGSIYVDVYPGENADGQPTGKSVSETIKWQEGSHMFEVDTFSDATNPIETGLAMAISMKPYAQ